jgi:hypothetical protein
MSEDKLTSGAEVKGMKGVVLTRPGLEYYFDDEKAKCPLCGGVDLEYRRRSRGTPKTIKLKCSRCNAKFRKTRTTECDYYKDPAEMVVRIAPKLVCGNCGTGLGVSSDEFARAERVVCSGCHKVCKSRTDDDDENEPEGTDEN